MTLFQDFEVKLYYGFGFGLIAEKYFWLLLKTNNF